MKILIRVTFSILVFVTFFSCTNNRTSNTTKENRNTIEMQTDYGNVIIELYNETPLHRDNFTKLAEEGAFDSLLFHRVINEFMIQTGDPESRTALPGDTLGNGDLPYTVQAEFVPSLFHKKGALGAARNSNPERASSSMQFYIVQGNFFNDSLLINADNRINTWLAEHYFTNDSVNKPLVDAMQKASENDDNELYRLLNDSLNNLAKDYHNFEKYTIPEEHRNIYKTVGGTPHLDQNYTVFGQVIKGIEIVDSIAAVQTGVFDRPVRDVRIKKVRLIK